MTNVTIVTPVFNTQDYLHRCIKSVIEQEGVSLRYIIIDDGSTDNSASIARYYAERDGRIMLIQKENEGQGAARNIGIKLADSEFIYFVDSDDYLGKDMLRILYQQARSNSLDVCSPGVPKHYFEKPLEEVACLPCKSQFIRTDIVKKYGILQPNARSGQDGVFSHLVLTHCRRIGMAADATFHYTHAREGSTFVSYLKRHDVVPDIVAQHYAAIEAHYDQYGLWKKNALRLMSFIVNETLKNRLDPHLPHLTPGQLLRCFQVLCKMAQRAHDHLSAEQKEQIEPVLIALAKYDAARMVQIYAAEFLGKSNQRSVRNNNTTKGATLICKYLDESLMPQVVARDEEFLRPAPTGAPMRSGDAAAYPAEYDRQMRALRDDLKAELRVIRGKVDLSINTLNNAVVQVVSALRSSSNSVTGGIPDLVVSMTTLQARLHIVHSAIESILMQSIRPGRLVLWVAEDVQDNDIPSHLIELQQRGVEIRKVRDVGPHTKLIYALKEFPKCSIVTVDDDVIYPSNTLQALWEQHLRFPGAVICNWARELAFNEDGSIKGVREGKLLTPPLLESEIEQAEKFIATPNLLAFPYGTSGVLYPPGSLNERVFDVEVFKRLCPKEDDIWFKAMSLLNGTPVVTTNLGINPVHHCLAGSQHVALRHDNHGLQQNQKQMKAVFEHFDLMNLCNKVCCQ